MNILDYRVNAADFNLDAFDPDDTGGLSEKKALKKIAKYRSKIAAWQSKLYAEKKQSILIVLQALDAGGKDGTINHVFSALNPQGVKVTGFKQPTPEELAHDFLWRVHPHVPGKGEIAIFNRSHYEDVLVTRVHHLIDKRVCYERYAHIVDFERLLAENNTVILKFFLYISKDEQLQRFGERLKDPARNWKISDSDYRERLLWDDYIAAFTDAMHNTSSDNAPWFVIPANNKWYRNFLVSKILLHTLKKMSPEIPPPSVDLDEIRKAYHEAKKNS